MNMFNIYFFIIVINLPKQNKQLSKHGLEALFALKRIINYMSLNPTTKSSLVDCYIGGVVNYAKKIRGA